MEISSISSGLMLSQTLVGASTFQTTAAAAPVGVNDPEFGLRMKEQPVSPKVDKLAETQASPSEHAQHDRSATKIAQNTRQSDAANPEEVTPAQEGMLLDYIHKAENGPGSLEPSELFNSVTGSFLSVMEKAQGALSPQTPATEPSAGTGATEGEESSPAGDKATPEIDQILDRYVSVSWGVFSASLATNSVAAASSSINTLVKQQ